MFLSDKVCQSIKKLRDFARLSFYHILMLLVIVAYLDIKEPFKGFSQIHQVGRFTILIYDVFRDEQTADNFHNVDKGCFVSQIERGKRWFIKLPFKLLGIFYLLF